MTGDSSAPTDFVSTDSADPELTAAIAALTPRFTTSEGSAHAVRRSWLDTFDDRLAAAGMDLEQVRRGGETYLQLTDRDGRRVTAPAGELFWPAFATALPAGELHDRVAARTDIRALLVIGSFSGREREIRVLNEDEKTVARLVVEAPSGRSYADAKTVLSIRPVRGYHSDAERIGRLLAASASVAVQQTTRREDARKAQQSPSEGLDRAITPTMPAAEAVAAVLGGFRRTLEANVPGLLDDIDTEFLHDFRVAVRRARSTLKLTGQVLPSGRGETLEAELKWLGDLTSPTRDLDVYLLGIPAMTSSLKSAAPEDLQPFQEHLQMRRDVEQRLLARGVRSKRFRGLLDQWREIGALAGGNGARPGGGTAADLSRTSLSQALRRVVRLGGAITAASPAEDLHTLRKRCKELRYLLEIFAPVLDRAAHKQVLQVLKALQECLGDFQDSEVQAEALRSFAVQMTADGTAPPATLLAMGELAAALHAEQLRARAAFDGTFQRFMAAKNQRAFEELTGAPIAKRGVAAAAGGTR